MADPEHLARLLQGVEAWNRWRATDRDIRPDLSSTFLYRVDLSRADLSRVTLTQANLCEANLSRAVLHQTALFKADLSRAVLHQTDLSEANLSQANLSQVHLYRADLSRANCTGANLNGAILQEALLVETNFEDANLTGCRVYGITAWNVRLTGAHQSDLVITGPNEPVITVDNLEVAQFIYLLLHNEKIREVIDTIGKKGVLILGRFADERKAVLDALRMALRSRGFLPIVFDVEKSTERDFTETIRTLAGMSLFAIADITNLRPTPLELQATVPDYMIPFVPIIAEGESPSAMFIDLQHRYDWVLDVLEYDSIDHLLAGLQDAVIAPALQKHEALVQRRVRAVETRHIAEYLEKVQGVIIEPGGAGSAVQRPPGDVLQLLDNTRNLTIHRTSRGEFDAAPPIVRDLVDCTVFAPQRVALGEQVLIQVFAHMSEQAGKLEAEAQAADPEARRRGATTLSTEIARGARLMFALNIPRVRIDKPVQEIIWRGTIVSVQFSITVPKKLATALVRAQRPLSVVATISVSQEGVEIGQIKFILQIERMASKPDDPQITGQANRYQTAFISYASENRPAVLRYVQMLRLVGITYFQDLLSLDPGQRWSQQLYHQIDVSDVLFLFWSTAAKQSQWVTKEWRYGLKRKGLDFIKPVMIEGPPPVPPPKALARLHFNDWLLYVISAEEAARSGSTEGHGKL